MDSIDLAQDADRWGGTCKCRNEPSGSTRCGKFLSSCEPVNFSRSTLHHGVRLHSVSNSELVEGKWSNYARPLLSTPS
jgi:hypothetical protein